MHCPNNHSTLLNSFLPIHFATSCSQNLLWTSLKYPFSGIIGPFGSIIFFSVEFFVTVVNLLPRISLANFYILLVTILRASVCKYNAYLLLAIKKYVPISSKRDYENISSVMLMTAHDASLNMDVSGRLSATFSIFDF